jgi:hypothetical protein
MINPNYPSDEAERLCSCAALLSHGGNTLAPTVTIGEKAADLFSGSPTSRARSHERLQLTMQIRHR